MKPNKTTTRTGDFACEMCGKDARSGNDEDGHVEGENYFSDPRICNTTGLGLVLCLRDALFLEGISEHDAIRMLSHAALRGEVRKAMHYARASRALVQAVELARHAQAMISEAGEACDAEAPGAYEGFADTIRRLDAFARTTRGKEELYFRWESLGGGR